MASAWYACVALIRKSVSRKAKSARLTLGTHGSGTPKAPTVSHTPWNQIGIGREYSLIHLSSNDSWVSTALASARTEGAVPLRYRSYNCFIDTGDPGFNNPHFDMNPARLRAVKAPRLKPKINS